MVNMERKGYATFNQAGLAKGMPSDLRLPDLPPGCGVVG